ncbi:hypothetical protein J437_LFUL002125 [Ladona fulva]|uniref:SH2 domain-containing protein n=1 Tax=Ladona fulva TaxID=123851 RepID=A0A8K0JTE6_LADFU|nr:hypothetical protein J437_LFUL002125 [Ladona fulva]
MCQSFMANFGLVFSLELGHGYFCFQLLFLLYSYYYQFFFSGKAFLVSNIGLVPRNYLQELSEYLTEPYRGGAANAVGNGSGGHQVVPGLEGPRRHPPPPSISSCAVDRPHLLGKAWYFGAITRARCDQLLNEHGQDGDFLIRDSETNIGDYSVSLKAPGRNKHFRVHVEGALYCIGQRKFHTLSHLVDHYQRAPIYTNKQGEKLYLVRPLPKVGGIPI